MDEFSGSSSQMVDSFSSCNQPLINNQDGIVYSQMFAVPVQSTSAQSISLENVGTGAFNETDNDSSTQGDYNVNALFKGSFVSMARLLNCFI